MNPVTSFEPTQAEALQLEVLPPSAIESQERALIDVQIATAKRYPRNIAAVKKSMLSFATLDQETAESCFYTLPRGGKNIQGASVRLAEIAVSCYGNLRVGSRIIETVTGGDSPHVTVQSICHDLEQNIAVTIEKRRRIVAKKDFKSGGKKAIDEDDINLAANAGAAIAFRDAVFKVVPLALIKPVLDQTKLVAIGDVRTLADRRAKAIDAFAKMGIGKDRVLSAIGKRDIEEVGVADIETLIGYHTSIKEGQADIDELFPDAKRADKLFTPAAASPIPDEIPGIGAAAEKPQPMPEPAKTQNQTPAGAKKPAPKQEAKPEPKPEPEKPAVEERDSFFDDRPAPATAKSANASEILKRIAEGNMDKGKVEALLGEFALIPAGALIEELGDSTAAKVLRNWPDIEVEVVNRSN